MPAAKVYARRRARARNAVMFRKHQHRAREHRPGARIDGLWGLLPSLSLFLSSSPLFLGLSCSLFVPLSLLSFAFSLRVHSSSPCPRRPRRRLIGLDAARNRGSCGNEFIVTVDDSSADYRTNAHSLLARDRLAPVRPAQGDIAALSVSFGGASKCA